MKLPRQSIPEPASRAGFTLIELCVVLATVAVLAAVLLPALADTKPNSQAFQCLNNQRQIMLAWQMYAADNSDLLPPNDFYSGGSAPVNPWFGPRLGQCNWVVAARIIDPIITSQQTPFCSPRGRRWDPTIQTRRPIIVLWIRAW